MSLRRSVLVRFASVSCALACGASCSDPPARSAGPAGEIVRPGSTGSTGASSGSTSSTSTSSTSGGGGGSTSSSTGGGGGGSAPAPVPRGFLHTSGAQIVDDDGQPVRITGINWAGFETGTFAPHGLDARSMGSLLDQVRSLGYNTLRVPIGGEIFDASIQPSGIDYGKNPELAGLSGLALVDAVVDAARMRGLKILFDRHRLDVSGPSHALWYSSAYPESRVTDEWKTLALRYHDDPTVIGFDLWNEPHGDATWGSDDTATDWRLAAERMGDAILAVHPRLLIVVEGVQVAEGQWYWWGGNLRGAAAHPVTLSVPNQLVYSTHDYPVSVSSQPWFFDLSYPNNMPGIWDQTWGYLVKDGIAPVLVGEFGSKYESWMDRTWMRALAKYLGDNEISFTYWCLNPESVDTGGLLADDWTTVHADKQALLAPLLAPPLP